MDAESNDNTPAIALSLFYEDIYRYAGVVMYNMHILGKITFQVFTTLHILIREIGDVHTHINGCRTHKTTSTSQFYVHHDNSDVHSTHISRKTLENTHRREELWTCLYTLNER